MTRARIPTPAGIIQLAMVAALFLMFLFSRPVTVAETVLGITPTAAPATPGPTSTPIPPPTSTIAPVTPLPSPTSTPVPPTAAPPKPKTAQASPTPTLILILPLSGGKANQTSILWTVVGTALLFGWLLHRLGWTYKGKTSTETQE